MWPFPLSEIKGTVVQWFMLCVSLAWWPVATKRSWKKSCEHSKQESFYILRASKGPNGRPPPTVYVATHPKVCVKQRQTTHVMNHTCSHNLHASYEEKLMSFTEAVLRKSKYERFCLKDFLKNPYLRLQEPCHFRSRLETSFLMRTPVRVHAGGECTPRLFQDVKYVDIPVPWFSLWVWSIGPVALGGISLLCNLQLTDMFCAKSIDIAKWGHFGFPLQTDTPERARSRPWRLEWRVACKPERSPL